MNTTNTILTIAAVLLLGLALHDLVEAKVQLDTVQHKAWSANSATQR